MGWETSKLGDVCVLIGGGTPSKSNESFYGGDIPWATVRDMKNDLLTSTELKITKDAISKSSTKLIPLGSVITATRVGLGKVCLLQQDTAINQDLKAVIPKNKGLNNNFLYWWLKSVAHVIEAAGIGATVKGVKLPFVKSLEIPLPPIPEQNRIVAILDQAFADIEQAHAKTEQNLKNARELFESCLNKRLLNICSRTPMNTLSNITELIVDCEHKTAPTQEEGFPSIRTPNIGKGELILDNVKQVSKETYDLWTKRAIPEPGDLILAREAPAGNVGVIPRGQKVCLGQRTVLIRPIKGAVDSKCLAFLLLHPIMQNRLLAHSTGATVQHVNMKDIRQLGISELPDIKKQQEHAKILLETKAQVSLLEKVYFDKLNALDELKKSILQKAFSGELTKEVAA